MDPIQPLPFVIGVIGDFAGQSERDYKLWEGGFVFVEASNFDEVMSRIHPTASFSAPNLLTNAGSLSIHLNFARLDDFRPDSIINQTHPLSRLEEARQQCLRALAWLRSQPAVTAPSMLSRRSDAVRALLSRYSDEPVGEQGERPALLGDLQLRYADLSGSDDLITMGSPPLSLPFPEQGKPFSVDDFVRQIGNRPGATRALDAIVTQLDNKINQQLDAIMHHPRLQALESSWRSLHRLVLAVAGTVVRIHVRDISLREFPRQRYQLERSRLKESMWTLPLSKELYSWGGHPFVLLLSSHLVGIQPEDIQLLQLMASTAAQFNALVIAGADPRLFDLEDFTQLDLVADLKQKMNRPESVIFNSFRDHANARNVIITLPSFIGRPPHPGSSHDRSSYSESISHNTDYLWCNPAFVLAEALANSFKDHPYCGERIRAPGSAGEIQNLAAQIDTGKPSAGGVSGTAKLSDAQCVQLSELGFSPMRLQLRGSSAAFTTLRTVRELVDENREHEPEVALEHRLVLARLCHHVAHECRRMSGSFTSIEDAERVLNQRFAEEIQQRRHQSPTALLESAQFRLRLTGKHTVTVEVEAILRPVTMLGSAATLRKHFMMDLPQ